MASEKNFIFLTYFEFFSCIFNVCHFSVDTRPRVVRKGLLSVDNSVSITTKRQYCLSCACLGLAVSVLCSVHMAAVYAVWKERGEK